MLIGRKLKGRYHIYDELGEGGAGKVYLARDIETGQIVVVKVVHNYQVNQEFMARFRREIDLLKELQTPHVIRLYDWALEEEDPETQQVISYIVAEFVAGLTLATIIDRRGKLPETDALTIAKQVASGLADIHARGIVHRDVKSQNIMITPQNEAKLIDFGIAKGEQYATLTGRGVFAGTLHYAPPEQILEAHEVDHRADIYSLGVVLYEMLTGRLPVSGEFGTIATRILAGDLDPLPEHVSQPVRDLVTSMLSYRVEKRPATAALVIQRIERIIGSNTTTLVYPGENFFAEPPPQPQPSTFLITSTGMSIPLTQQEVIIGRSARGDSAIPDVDLWSLNVPDARTASRRHCRIFCDGRGYFIEDLGSLNGTCINNTRLAANEPHQLHDGDVILAGRVELTFRISAE